MTKRSDYNNDEYIRHRIEYHVAWVRWLLGVILAILVSIMIVIYIVRDNLVDSCVRNSASKLVDAQFFEAAAKKNFSVASTIGNPKVSKENSIAGRQYLNFAASKRATIPYKFQGAIDEARGDTAKGRKQGCADTYPRPIPFVR